MDIKNMMRAIAVGGAVCMAFSALPASAATIGHQLQSKGAVFDDATPADPAAPADPAPTDPAPDPAPQGN